MKDWENLLLSPPDRSLEALEQDVARAVTASRAEDRRSVGLLMAQAALCALSICGGLAWGGFAASRSDLAPPLGAFSPSMALAPSSRLAVGAP